MNRLSSFWKLGVVSRVVFGCIFITSAMAALAASRPSADERKRIEEDYNLLPLRFEPNRGQSRSDAEFIAQGPTYSALFKEDETDFLLASRTTETAYLKLVLLNASRNAKITGEDRLPGTANYFLGNDSEQWHTGVPTFQRIRYANLYPGTDLIYYGIDGRLEFDFQVSPGADPDSIRLLFEGAQSLKIDEEGNLTVAARGGHVSFIKPSIYQPSSNGGKDNVKGSFKIVKGITVGFNIDRYDHSRPLIIDPIFNYSTYIGAPYAVATAVAVDQEGEAFVTGSANLNFPTTPGSYQPVAVSAVGTNGTAAATARIFVAKLNSSGTALLYSTFLSGSGMDSSYGLALDGGGDAFIVGSTSSTDFPTTTGALQTQNTASQNKGFVAALNSTGSALLYSTYLGGSTATSVSRVTLDASGNAYVTGSTQDTDFPTTAGAFQTASATKTTAGLNSAFVAKLNSSGSGLVYSTYLGGNQSDTSNAIAVDGAGAAYVGGNTTSTNFPTTAGAFQQSTESNKQAGFIAKLNATGTSLAYSTFLSGNNVDAVTAIALDSTGAVYATGDTTSPNFPITAGAYQTEIGFNGFGFPQTNAFMSKLNAAGSALEYSTFLGGNSSSYLADLGDAGNAIQLDGQGNAIVSGTACTTDFPITLGAFEPQNLAMETSNQCSSFLTKLTPVSNTPLVYSTYLGGSGDQTPYYGDRASSAAIDPSGNVYVVGYTVSVDFPTTAGYTRRLSGTHLRRGRPSSPCSMAAN